MNHPGEISLLSRLARPGAALITDIGTAHVGHLGSREAILAAKLEILEGSAPRRRSCCRTIRGCSIGCPRAIRAGADRHLRTRPGGRLAPGGPGGARARRHPLRDPRRPGPWSSPFSVPAACSPPWPRWPGWRRWAATRRPWPPAWGAPRAARCAWSRAAWAAVDWVLDCYNASPESTRLAIGFLREVPHSGRRILVLGELGELGSTRRRSTRSSGERAGAVETRPLRRRGRASGASRPTGRRPSRRRTAAWVGDAEEAAEWLRPRLRPGDLVLLKGSRRIGLERIVDAALPSGRVGIDQRRPDRAQAEADTTRGGGPGDRRRSR